MATTSRPGVGGKIVAKRRGQRLAATPYDRPPRNPNWFTGVVIPSARALASGAGKIFTSMFSESSSEDEGDSSEEDVNDGLKLEYNALNEENEISSPQIRRKETKQLIEKLIGQENFSREEFDRLTGVLKSRVVDCSVEAGETNIPRDSPRNAIGQDGVDIYDKAVQEAKSWFQDKIAGSASSKKLPSGNVNSNSAGIDHMQQFEGSPVDVARSYLKQRAPWASPTQHDELLTPLALKMDHFGEGTTRSVGYDSFSSSKSMLNRTHLASGSWNLEEEKRRVRSKAIDDLLRASSSKVDPLPLSYVLERSHESLKTRSAFLENGGKLVEPKFSTKTNPTDVLLDAEMSSDTALAALNSRPDDIAREELPSTTAAPSKDPEVVMTDVECAEEKPLQPHGPSIIEENHTDANSSKVDEPVTEGAGNTTTNGVSSPKPSMPEDRDKNSSTDAINEKMPSTQLPTENYTEVPVVAERNNVAGDHQKPKRTGRNTLRTRGGRGR